MISTALLLLAADAGLGQTQAVLKQESFEITLPPGFPAAKPTQTGDATGSDFSSEGKNGIARIQYLDLKDPNMDADALFKTLRISNREGMRIDSDEEFTHQGHRGLRMFITATALNQSFRMDCILAGRRLYRIWYIARTPQELAAPDVRAFFDSFRVR